jgi:AcrR family transcriptional regulator
VKHTKTYILDRALKLFNKKGFVNVRLQHIADFGDISVGHLAYHFRTKETLLEALYDQLKTQQEKVLYEFRMAHLLEDIDGQLRAIFHCQQQYVFFYLDTLELLRGSSDIAEKHRKYMDWQLQQIEWMFLFNVDCNTFLPPSKENQYQHLAWMFWLTIDNWMYARQIRGMDHLDEERFTADLWLLLTPYLTPAALEDLQLMTLNSGINM